jgi:hypothetical protein
VHKRPIIEKTVKPRKIESPFLPIISYTADDCIYSENRDTYYPPSDLYSLIASEPRSILIAKGMAPLLYQLHRKFHSNPLWQFSCTPIEHFRFGANRMATGMKSCDLAIQFFGFRGNSLPDGPRGGKRQEANVYHIAIDPVTFAKSDSFLRDDVSETQALYIWGTQLRHFCWANDLAPRATAGGVAGQLLRDPRFYPKARRKVPAATNRAARVALPGNHYRLYEKEGAAFNAYYLDQVSAHHTCASAIKFPSANQLRAKGNFKTLIARVSMPRSVLKQHGLFYLKLDVPHMRADTFPPPWAEKPGMHNAYVFSNELPLLRSLHVSVECVIAAWTSPVRDFGLNRYARWAVKEAKADPDSKQWKKPLLLSTYGILAATPRKHRVGFAQAETGRKTVYQAGPHRLPVYEKATERDSEPGYANVIHRGMIEAECRMRSLILARDLTEQGHVIFAVYADSVFVKADDPNRDGYQSRALPMPPPGWTVEAVLTELRFHSPVSFTSQELQKLPGVPRSGRIIHAAEFGNAPRARSL